MSQAKITGPKGLLRFEIKNRFQSARLAITFVTLHRPHTGESLLETLHRDACCVGSRFQVLNKMHASAPSYFPLN